MRNVLSFIGMSLQSEVCLWTLLGLVRTIFDATLFKVNANLKQVWQMSMPEELSLPVQRVLRTMISGIMLVQCFTVYVYLASYIVLLYPVFLEERPILVLPWLLLAAIRKLLCELTSLALGLGTCVLLGAARPPCIKFVVIKVISIMPSFYMWMLLYNYYHVLKVASVFKTFPVDLPPSGHDYGLELAVRRRRTKSLLGEDQLRRRLTSNFYNERHTITTDVIRYKPEYSSRMSHATDTSAEDNFEESPLIQTSSATPNRMMSDTGCYEDWFGSEVMVPRDSDRIMEQFGVMMLRISAYLSKGGTESGAFDSQFFSTGTHLMEHKRSNYDCTTMPPDDTETPPLVGSSKEGTASYLRDYPQIFRKKPSDIPLHSDMTLTLTADDRIATSQILKNHTHVDDNENANSNKICSTATSSNEVISVETKTSSDTQKIKIETSQTKLKTMSSDKSVSFKSGKANVPTAHRSGNEEIQEASTSKSEIDRSVNIEEKDSLESVIEDIKNRRSLKIKSVKKDETKNKTRSKTSRQDKESRDSSDSSFSNKSNAENKKNK